MNRAEKEQEVGVLREKFQKAQLAILADYKGLTVAEFNQLRRNLEAKNSAIKVVKNRLAKIAAKGTPQEILTDFFKGTTAVATTEADPTGPAKVLIDFIKENEKVVIKAAAMLGRALSTAEVKALASLPSREVLLAKMMGSMLAPATNWVSVLAQIPRSLVNVLAAVRVKKGKEQS